MKRGDGLEGGEELCGGRALREACAEGACAPGDGGSEEVASVGCGVEVVSRV